MLTILHTNDLHSHTNILPRLAALIQRERQRAPSALLVDACDMAMDRPVQGLNVKLARALRYDALTTGNYENEVRAGRAALAQIGASCVVANIAPGALGFETTPFLLRDVNCIRVALLGLTTAPVYPIGHPLHRPNAEEVFVSDPLEAARDWVPRLRVRADLLIVLSHLGLRGDVKLAQAVPGIDLIIGGHSHHRLPSLLRIGATHIAQAGVNGAYLGVIDVRQRAGGFQLEGRLAPVWQEVEPDRKFAEDIRAFIAQNAPAELEAWGKTDSDCWADPWQENAWANFVTDSLRAHAEADICFFKAGSLIPALDAGLVRKWDVEQCINMEPEDLVRMTLSGEAVRAICEHSVADLPWDDSAHVARNFCMPGNTLIHASGIEATYDLQAPRGERARRLLVGGQPLDPARRYTVAVPEFLAKGYSGFHWFRDGGERHVVGSQRAVMRAALQSCHSLPPLDGRLRF